MTFYPPPEIHFPPRLLFSSRLNFTFSYYVIQFLTFLHASQNIGVYWTLASNFKILYTPSLRCNLFVAQDLSTFFSYHPKLFLLILMPTFFQFFPIVFFCRMVNSLSGLKTNAVVTIYFNSTSNAAYGFSPTLRSVSFKQPRYYSNQIPPFATNKEGRAMLINAKRSTKKKTKSKKKTLH